MSFELVQPSRYSSAAGRKTGVWMRYWKGSTKSVPSLSISLTGVVAERIGWKAGDRVAYFIGTGHDAGKLALKVAKEGNRLGKLGGHKSKSTSIGVSNAREDLMNQIAPFEGVEDVHWALKDGMLILTLPKPEEPSVSSATFEGNRLMPKTFKIQHS